MSLSCVFFFLMIRLQPRSTQSRSSAASDVYKRQELGYYSRLRLFKLVLLNIAFAGASELVREVGMDWMSQDLAARLSTRAAQGIGAGLLTARLGIKAMELCRPLPWIDDDKPRLGDFRRQLIGQVKETLQKGKTPSEK